MKCLDFICVQFCETCFTDILNYAQSKHDCWFWWTYRDIFKNKWLTIVANISDILREAFISVSCTWTVKYTVVVSTCAMYELCSLARAHTLYGSLQICMTLDAVTGINVQYTLYWAAHYIRNGNLNKKHNYFHPHESLKSWLQRIDTWVWEVLWKVLKGWILFQQID
jgi:hypothetical protein